MNFHYELMVNQSIYQKLLMKKLSGTGLTLGQPKVLEYLSTNDGASQNEIAAACYVEAASLTTTLNGMEAKGLVERRRLNGNRRNYYVFLTDKGKEMYQVVKKTFLEMEEETLGVLSETERELFSKMYEKISNQIKAMQEEM